MLPSPSLSWVALLLSLVASDSAAQVVTASNRASAPGRANSASIVELYGSVEEPNPVQTAQFFLAKTDGALLNVSVMAGARDGQATRDGLGLRVAITEFDDTSGEVGKTLATAQVEGVELLPQSDGRFADRTAISSTADFSKSGVVLRAGRAYAMVFTAERFRDSFFVLGGTRTGYDEGAAGGSTNGGRFRFSRVTDLFFEVAVDPIN